MSVRGSFTSCVFRFSAIAPFFLVLGAGFAPQAIAQTDAEQPAASQGEYEEDYDFSWLDPDKKIYVVQNRKYLKGRKLELSVGAGLNLSGPYTSSSVFNARGGYFFNEQFGISIIGYWQTNKRNDTFEELMRTSSVFPNIRDVSSFYGGTFVWLPFYGKFNFFNTILYVDWAIEAGVASVSSRVNLTYQANVADNFTTATYTGFVWGTGFKFFLSQMFAIRLDMLALYYSAPVIRQGVTTTQSNTNTNYYTTLGISAHF